MLKEKIQAGVSGILLYGITPPKAHYPEEKLREVAARTIGRIQPLGADGLVVYDLQDESARNAEARPFPFMATLDAEAYATDYLQALAIPKIIYRSVGKSSEEALRACIRRLQHSEDVAVFVGSPSRHQQVAMKLHDAYDIWGKHNQTAMLGGVTIPERHAHERNEHTRILAKRDKGCAFFISQCVYNIEFVKNTASDLYYHCKDQQLTIPTIIFTLTTCGSLKTLEFLDWLGIDVPVWLRNELYHCEDILSKSVDLSMNIAWEITEFCLAKGIPFGFNIESVSIRKEEIEASAYLFKSVEAMLRSKGLRSETTAQPAMQDNS